MLTQALNEQEAKKESQTPPAKKHKSLVQSLFADDDEDMDQMEVTNVTSKKITFASILETREISDDEKDVVDTGEKGKQSCSIYIEETDDEDE